MVASWMKPPDVGNIILCVGLICVCVVDFGVSVFMLVIITLEGEGFSSELEVVPMF